MYNKDIYPSSFVYLHHCSTNVTIATLSPTGIVASVLIAIILIVILVLKYIVFRVDPSYKVTEDKGYQQGASAALLGNQVMENVGCEYVVSYVICSLVDVIILTVLTFFSGFKPVNPTPTEQCQILLKHLVVGKGTEYTIGIGVTSSIFNPNDWS